MLDLVASGQPSGSYSLHLLVISEKKESFGSFGSFSPHSHNLSCPSQAQNEAIAAISGQTVFICMLLAQHQKKYQQHIKTTSLPPALFSVREKEKQVH